MFYLLGFLRRTPLYGLIALPVSIFVFKVSFADIYACAFNPTSLAGYFAAFMFWSIIAYPVFVAIHLLAVKISDKHRGLGDAYISALGVDITAPFRYVGMFFLVIAGKHKIKDDSTFHDMGDLFQVIFGFVWTIAMIVFFLIGFLNIGNL